MHLTPTEERMYSVLSDNLPHTKAELFTCLGDSFDDPKTVNVHLSRLRKKLEVMLMTIEYGQSSYRLTQF
jgi:DNA-binding CsgD family transcriptional regulator